MRNVVAIVVALVLGSTPLAAAQSLHPRQTTPTVTVTSSGPKTEIGLNTVFGVDDASTHMWGVRVGRNVTPWFAVEGSFDRERNDYRPEIWRSLIVDARFTLEESMFMTFGFAERFGAPTPQALVFSVGGQHWFREDLAAVRVELQIFGPKQASTARLVVGFAVGIP